MLQQDLEYKIIWHKNTEERPLYCTSTVQGKFFFFSRFTVYNKRSAVHGTIIHLFVKHFDLRFFDRKVLLFWKKLRKNWIIICVTCHSEVFIIFKKILSHGPLTIFLRQLSAASHGVYTFVFIWLRHGTSVTVCHIHTCIWHTVTTGKDHEMQLLAL